jgi:ribosomal protein S18 acetylase RimI-like enzyme
MRLTSITLGEVDSVVDLVNQAYRGVTTRGWTTEAGLIEGRRADRVALSQMIQDGRTMILIAKDQASQAIQGCVAVRPMENGEWYLSMLAVSPACQANGMGKSIMAAAEAFVGERGARSVKISVINVRDSLIAWYERRGYARTGNVEPFPYDDPSIGVPLRKDLTLITLRKPLQPPLSTEMLAER